jgi:hypothetical protein
MSTPESTPTRLPWATLYHSRPKPYARVDFVLAVRDFGSGLWTTSVIRRINGYVVIKYVNTIQDGKYGGGAGEVLSRPQHLQWQAVIQLLIFNDDVTVSSPVGYILRGNNELHATLRGKT